MDSTLTTAPLSPGRTLWSKVPEVTAFFWIVKVMATTVGETAADYLNRNLHLGLTGTTLLMSVLLALALVAQFRTKRYVPGVYWLAIVLISVVGTLITDNLTDNFGVSLWTSTGVFSVALIATFALWYRREGTLSIHSIFTPRREAYYWLAILFTFALGTAAGDLMAEQLQLGYLPSALIFAGVIAAVALAHVYGGLNGILAFWLAYIVTRPLGASIGDYLSQGRDVGGLGLGSTALNAIFLCSILAVVAYLTFSRRDQVRVTEPS
ncbi:hypothetical membrane-anchored protein [Deinococcus aerius]|uniref:Membrane-anchored protein n=2 Tax=Deinococcus TaxID=1298 RepID=A0AAJ5FAR5_9DEIO|nr:MULTISPECIES: hypothetical protein [Deinococcus]MBB5293990.1 putative membrane-anchored protein [Deinococcus metallilatus]QBY07444.1 hypothetical protein E5F05_05605 [Deinococcus metallilatus]RXJ14557.1 hypothetical protein ERJ73_02340 [Deinococcus metallilatus]TLK30677.1 hypothetical protein FCS05_02655 [Deinococcus metallilatus]GBF04551.1 hypothetical membrane-anchored protein [Deinococcus aerius]